MKKDPRYTIRPGFQMSRDTDDNTLEINISFTEAGVVSPYYALGSQADIRYVRDSVSEPELALETCPVCHRSNMHMEKKKFLGLLLTETLVCGNCEATLKSSNGKYELAYTKDTSSPVWVTYQHQALEPREWNKIERGGMSDLEQKKADITTWMEGLRDGRVELRYTGDKTPLVLKQNEKILYSLPEVTLMEPKSVRVSRGRYGGPSIRVSKNVSFRVGQFGSTARSHSEIRKVDTGSFTVTDRRIVFSGGMKTINADLSKIVDIEPFDDGIALHRTTSQKTQYFDWSKSAPTVEISVGGRNYKELFTGLIFKYLLQGITKR